MADEKYAKWKKRYEAGEIKTATMPPLPGGPGMIGRAASGLRGLKQLYDKSQKDALRNAKRREAAAIKREAAAEAKAARAKEKFGPLVKREENLPATQGGRAVVKRKDNLPATQSAGSRSLTVAREGKGDLVRTGGGRSLATTGGRTFGDKGQGGRIVGLSNKGKLALGAGAIGAAAGAAAYKKAGGAGADTKSSLTSGPRDDRASSLSASKSDKASEFKSKMQGRKVPGSPTSTDKKPVKAASDKSRYKPKAAKAEKPLSNFERMKARGYEKEGYGGRSMTSKGAESRVKKERSFKFKDLFKK